MKKILSLAFAILLLVSCSSCNKEEEIQCTEEHIELKASQESKTEKFQYSGYEFYRSVDDKNVIAEFCSECYKEYKSIREYDVGEVTKESFAQVQEGMNVYEVVELVGVPYASYTSGFQSMVFKTDANEEYTIYFADFDRDGEITVTSVVSNEKVETENS